MKRRKVTKKLAALLLSGALVFSLSGVTALATEAEPVSSTFTFTNQGETEEGDETLKPEKKDSGETLEKDDENGETGSEEAASAAKTSDVNTGVYTVSALAAVAVLLGLMGVTVSRRRRYGKEGR